MRGGWLLAAVVACASVGCAGETDPAGDDGNHDTDVPDTDDTDDTDLPPPRSDLSVVINEVMPGNQSTIERPDATRPDWIELLNVGDAPVSLADLVLRNDEGTEWHPEDGEIGPGERLLVWADEATFSDAYSTGFPLDKDGDKLTVLDAEGLVVDYLDLDAVDSDVAFARIPDGTGDLVPTAWPTPGEVNGDAPSPTLNAADATLFVPYVMHRIDFEFTPEAFNQISNPNRPEVHVAMTIDGLSYPDIGLKLKGSASYQTMDRKPAFMVDLNNWVTGTKFRGLKAFKLHNGVVLDPTRNRDWLTYQLAREAGLMSSRVGWADVYCNGEYYGFYILVEKQDDDFIEYFRPGQKDLGVMLEPNESSDGGWSGGDFGSGSVLSWNFEEGPIPPDPLVVESLQQADALFAGPATDERVEELWNYVDKDRLFSYMAWETVVMHTDGYHAPNNWRVYIDGSTHKIELVPAGVEWTWDYDVDPWWSNGRAASWCLSNPGCRRGYAERLLEVADMAEDLDLYGQFVEMQAWLDPYIQSDPRYQGSWAPLGEQRQSTSRHLQQNPGRARTMVGREYPDLVP